MIFDNTYIEPSEIHNKLDSKIIDKFESFVDGEKDKNKIVALHKCIRNNGFIDNYLMLHFNHDPPSTRFFDIKTIIMSRVQASFIDSVYGELENITDLDELFRVNNIFRLRVNRIRYMSSLGDESSVFDDNKRYGDEFQELLNDFDSTLKESYSILSERYVC